MSLLQTRGEKVTVDAYLPRLYSLHGMPCRPRDLSSAVNLFFCREKEKEKKAATLSHISSWVRHLRPRIECVGGLTVDNCIVSSAKEGCDDVLINGASDG